MKLMKFELHGFKRFKNPTRIILDGKVIAIVGPNEAGKSSILASLQKMDDNGPFVISGAHPEISRNSSFKSNHYVLTATYYIEDDDRASLSSIDGAENARWYTLHKKLSGGLVFSFHPEIERNLKERKQITKLLNKVLKKVEKYESKNLEKGKETSKNIAKVISSLDERENITESEIELIRSLSGSFLSSGIAASIVELQQLAKDLDVLADNEEEDPSENAEAIISERLPQFLYFDDASRDLKPQYNLTNALQNTPVAFRNFLQLAEIDLSKLVEAVEEINIGKVDKLILKANNILETKFRQNWSQSNVAVRLSVSGEEMFILVSEDDLDFVGIAERSDGMRQYVALLSFLTAHKTKSLPILLIDEAEIHLHYDAQADLMQMFTEQDVVSKIIYTTHSIGCLPEDLGAGIRVVKQIGDQGESTVENYFWDDKRQGFSPLLAGMGATTVAFVPIRYSVICEGASEMVLLPTIFRQLTGNSQVGFQIVPGLSQLSEEGIAIIQHESPRTLFLTDGDAGGIEIQKKLAKAGIDAKRCFLLPKKPNAILLEDYIKADLYVKAINEECKRSYGDTYVIKASDLSVTNRPEAVKKWCKSHNIRIPSKVVIANRILEYLSEDPTIEIIDKKHRGDLLKLHESMIAAFNDIGKITSVI